ncbi:sulfatase [Prosthecobacter sp.]|uniref:sulfatase n=1 Tax=Prosthecobacter sp. TaxID=1965333 RepID=UPI003783AE4A
MRQPLAALLSSFALSVSTLVSAAPAQPNIVVIFMDDMGYADVSCFGAQGYQTPNIDRLAAEGRKFTNFHVSQPVCSASRTALLTGCYSNRLGIHGALGPTAKHGINSNEMTLAELVKQKGYATAAVGKWHLGSMPQFLPTKHGFDQYYGLPYSNDMWPYHPQAKKAFPNLPMIENDQVVDAEVTPEEQTHLTHDYTIRGVQFIEKNKDKPFFLYLAHSMVHVPLFVSDKFKGRSGKGLFADVMMEVDWSVGQIMESLKENGLEENTWVIFTSDNGPWLSYGEHAGSAGPLREGKGTCWEGGTRVAGIMKWPGKIPAGTTTDTMMMTIDVLPTIAHVIDAKLPEHKIDGLNCWPIVSGVPDAKNPHDFYAFYYEQNQLQAITSGDGRWKLQLPHTFRSLPAGQPKAKNGIPVNYTQVKVEQPELYDLYTDISESKNLASQNPAEVARLQKHAETIRAELGDSLMKMPNGTGSREAGK